MADSTADFASWLERADIPQSRLTPEVVALLWAAFRFGPRATAAAQYKSATLETGLKISVPPFIAIGDVLQIDTRTGEYLSRAK